MATLSTRSDATGQDPRRPQLPLQFAAETGMFASALKRLNGDMWRTSITAARKRQDRATNIISTPRRRSTRYLTPWPCFARERARPYKTASAPRESVYAPGFHAV
jgi:hypothetical protein